MATLAIDTTGKLPNVAVVHEGKSFHCFGESGSSTEELPGLVAKLLETATLDFAALERIIIAVGPGSFTGIRTGVSFAQGIATARQCPLLGLDVISARFALLLPSLTPKRYVATLRANKSEFFYRSFVLNQDHSLGDISEIAVVAEEDLRTSFPADCLLELDSLELEQDCAKGMLNAWCNEEFTKKPLFQHPCANTPLELLYVKPVHALTIAQRQARAENQSTQR